MEEGIKRSYENADLDWKDAAEKRVFWLVKHKRFFTSDDVITHLDAKGIKTHNNSALGGVMLKYKNQGFIKPIGYQPATRKSRHNAPLRIWESQIFNKEEA